MSIVGVVLPLLGYGVALAIESELRIPPAILIGSPVDYLQLSIYGVVFLVEGMTRLSNSWTSIILGKRTVELYIAVVVAMSLALTARWVFHARISRFVARSPLSKRVERAIDPLMWGTQSSPVRLLRTLGVSLCIAVFGIAAQAIALMSLWFVICLVLLGLVLFPMIGYGAGKEYLKEYVVTPSRCAPLVDRSSRISSVDPGARHGAACVVVCKNKDLLGYGRVALATAKITVLFDPATGDVSGVSTDGTTIRVVPVLDPPELVTLWCGR